MKKFIHEIGRFIQQIFQEDNHNYSSARFLAVCSVISFIMDWQLHIWTGQKFEPTLTLVGFVLGVVGIKTIQKFAEIRTNNTNNTTNNFDMSIADGKETI